MSTSSTPPPISRFVDVDGVRLHAVDWDGDGPPLLLVHGGRRTGRSWNAVARRLRDVFRVIGLDIRGHGDSEPSVTGNDSLGRANDMAAVANGLGLGAHSVMAHSLGCFPAVLYASHYAEQLKNLVLIEPMPDIHQWWTRGAPSKSEWLAGRGSERRNGWDSIDDLRGRLENGSASRDWTPEVIDDILREETRTFPDGRVEIKWHPSVYNLDEMWDDMTSLIEEASRIPAPTLVIARAGNDQIESHLKPFTDALPHGQIRIVPKLGHSMYLEDPSGIADIARGFLTR